MGIAREFSKRLHREIGAHAAWLPIANSFEVGDFGLVSNGVFQRMGNVTDEFGVQIRTEEAPQTSLNFASEGTNTVRIVGDAEVDVLPGEPIEAKLRIEFKENEAFYVKAATVTQISLPDVGRVARELDDSDRWKRRFRVIHGALIAHDAAVILSRGQNASVELSGTAEALKQFELGSVSGGVTVSSEKNVGFTTLGRTGTIGLNLFKLKFFSGGPKFLGDDGEPEIEMDESEELEDDV